MSLRGFLAACIAIGMHSSVCTGGFFAVTAAIAEQAAYHVDASGPMSYGAIGYLSCKSTERTTGVRTTQEPGCDNATTCLNRISAATKNTLYIPTQLAVTTPQPLGVIHYHVAQYVVSNRALARAGPLYEDAITLTRHTKKLE